MSDETYDFENEFLDEDEKMETKRRYDDAYVHTVKRMTDSIENEDERQELIDELSQRHNLVRSKDPFVDAEMNLLKAKAGVEVQHKSIGNAAQSYLDFIDKTDGRGSGIKLLKKSQARQDDAYFESLKKEGRF